MRTSIFKPSLVAIAATAAALVFAMPPAHAVHMDLFQLDGDTQAATCGGAFGSLSCPTAQPDDWDSLYDCLNPDPVTKVCRKKTTSLADVVADLVDEFNGPDPDNFTQGTKDDMNVSSWHWGAASGSAKTNIMQSFAAKYDGNIYIGGNRDINNGDANFGVWLLQNETVECTAAMVTSGECATAGTFVGKKDPVTGVRSPVPHKIGDILIVSAFTNGGTVANINVYKVIQTVGNEDNPNAVPGTCPANAAAGYAGKATGTTGICPQQLITQSTPGTAACNPAIAGPPAIAGDAACAATNATGIAALDPRFKSSQSGSILSQYPALTFFEVGLSLDDLGLQTECFRNYIVAGRQSQSITASLNDFTLGKFQACSSGLATQASGPVIVGATITDTASVTGTAPPGHVAGGTVTFNAYSDSTCTTLVFGPNTKTVSGFGDYTSDAYTTTAVGTIYWVASYSGDGVLPAASGACGDANEASVVNKASPGIATSATTGAALSIGTAIHDTATLSGGFAPLTGTVTFTLYGPGDINCSNGAIFTSANIAVVSGSATSGNYTTTAAGTYRWKASYSGDSNNNGVDSACNDLNEASVIQPSSPGLTTAPTAKVILSDAATLSGGSSPTGSITFNLYQNTTCTGTPAFTATKTVTGSGAYASGDSQQFTVATPGTEFRWTVSYTGDANNNGASSPCTAEKVVLTITP